MRLNKTSIILPLKRFGMFEVLVLILVAVIAFNVGLLVGFKVGFYRLPGDGVAYLAAKRMTANRLQAD